VMRALITGAQGFVGRYLISALLATDPTSRIVGIGRSPACNTFTHSVTLQSARVPAKLPDELRSTVRDRRYEYTRADIRNSSALRSILKELRPNVIFHLASGLRDDRPHDLFQTNVEGTIDLITAVSDADFDLHALIIGSSGSVYGMPARLPITEDSACEPRDCYAASKLAQENVSRILARERGLPVVIARIFNIVGPGQDERHVAGRFAAQLAAIAGGTSEPPLKVGDLSTTRDFIDVRDVARALIVLAKAQRGQGFYNVASGVETTVFRVLEILIRSAGIADGVDVDTVYTRVSDTPRVVADIARLRAAGFKSAIPLEKSLADVFKYYGQVMPAAVS